MKWKLKTERDRDERKWEVDEAGSRDLAMTAATREQHANPWKSFPASSKTFMEF